MPQVGYSSTQVCNITQLPYGTLFEWMSTGLITPSLVKPQGRGKRVLWDFRDLVAIQTIQRLREHGLSMQGLRRIVAYIQQWLDIEHPLSECWLATDGRECYMLDGTQLLELFRQPGQMTLFHLLDLRSTTNQLRTRLNPSAGHQRSTKARARQGRPTQQAKSA
jgi:DNA-binding transcriptional MerR regulator